MSKKVENQTPEDVMDQENMEQTESVEQAEKSTGIQESGVNENAVSQNREDGEEGKFDFPSFFVEDDDRVTIEVDIIFDKENGRMVTVSRTGMLDLDRFQSLGHKREWFEFSPVTFEEISNYRSKCSVYNSEAGRILTDPVSLRSYLLVRNLKDWSICDRKGNKVELSTNENGGLDNESVKTISKMQHILLDVVMTLFEQEMMMQG